MLTGIHKQIRLNRRKNEVQGREDGRRKTNNCINSLVATIQSQRTDLLREFHTDAAPIPSQPPSDFFRGKLSICSPSILLSFKYFINLLFLQLLWFLALES